MKLLRSWLIRGGILAILAAGLGAVWLMHDYVRPERVKAMLLAALRHQLPDIEVEVGSASLRVFGGISVTDLTLTRKGEAEPFLAVASGHLSHDKESLNHGKLELRRLDLDGVTLRVARRADGSFDLADLAKQRPATPDKPDAELRPVPTITVKNATVLFTDHAANDPLPPLKLAEARFQLLNDPLPVLRVDGQFTLAVGALAVPMSVGVKFHRVDHAAQVRVEVPDLALTPDLAPVFARFAPDVADRLAPLSARLAIHADLRADRTHPLKADVRVEVREGRYDDEMLPWPLEHVAGTVALKDGKLSVEKLTAKLGQADIELSLEARPPAEAAAPAALPATAPSIEDRLERLTLTVRDLPLTPELFAKLPASAGRVRTRFNPVGGVDLNVTLQRTPAGLKHEYEVKPRNLSLSYDKFRYPIESVGGSLRRVIVPDGADEYDVKITGLANGRAIEMNGRVGAKGEDPLVDLRLNGVNVPIDDKLFAAMPPKYAQALAKLHAAGRANFTLEVQQPAGVNRCESTFRIKLFDGSVNADSFPYPLTQLRGQVFIRVASSAPGRPVRPGVPETVPPQEAALDTDRIELREFEAAHAAGRLWLGGHVETIPGSRDRRLALRVQGENLPLDRDFQAAVTALKFGELWKALAPRGAVTFGADVEILDRAAHPAPPAVASGDSPGVPVTPAAASLPGERHFNPAADLKLTLQFQGPAITPAGFPYDLTDLAGLVRYAGGKVDLKDLSAGHGTTRLTLREGEVRFGAGGAVWANLGRVGVAPLVVDAALLAALPPALRAGLAAYRPRGPMELAVRHLVVQLPGAIAPPAPVVPLVARAAAPDAEFAPPSTQMAPPPPPLASAAAAGLAVYWNGELKFNGVDLSGGVEATGVAGSVASTGLYDSGRLGPVVGNVWLDRATVAKQPLTNCKLTYGVRPPEPDPTRPGLFTPTALEFTDLSATVFEGTVGGQARVTFGEQLRYGLWLNASGVRIDQLAAHWKLGHGAELRGLAQGRVFLGNVPDPVTGLSVLTGSGHVDVPNGRLLNVPVLLPLLNLLKLQTPDQTAFEEAHALFEVRGDRVRVTQLDLVGTAISLGGFGELDLTGQDVRFEFYTVWSQAVRRWLATPLGDPTSLLSGNLFRLEMVKRPGKKFEYHSHVLPGITEPMKGVAERLRNRLGGLMPERGTYRPGETR